MHELELLKQQLTDINNKQIRLSTIVEQAKQQCSEIEEKYNITNEEELGVVLKNAEEEYQRAIEKATMYLVDAKQALEPYEDLI